MQIHSSSCSSLSQQVVTSLQTVRRLCDGYPKFGWSFKIHHCTGIHHHLGVPVSHMISLIVLSRVILGFHLSSCFKISPHQPLRASSAEGNREAMLGTSTRTLQVHTVASIIIKLSVRAGISNVRYHQAPVLHGALDIQSTLQMGKRAKGANN